MACSCKSYFLFALITSVGHASKHPYPVKRTPEQERAAQQLVAKLLREKGNAATAKVSSTGVMQWVPASSLEAQQDGKSQEEAEREIREEFEDVLGKDLIPVFEEDLVSMGKQLQATFTAIPKNEYGEVGYSGVRYALHRLFVARHGWFIQGIDPEGGSFNESSPADVLKGHVPDRVQQLIETLLYGRGFGLSEVALLGAILENLVHQEAIARLASVYEKFGVDVNTKLAPKQVDYIVELYMASYIMGVDARAVDKQLMKKLHEGIGVTYPGWKETQQFLQKVREDEFGNQSLALNQTVSVLSRVGEQHGRFQQKECVDMKQQLMALDDHKDGCVALSNFYKGMREHGKWQFSESPEYLRELGDLDESDPQNPKVMVSNYIDGVSNCVASSKYYSVCCINECEAILGRLEQHFQAPDALPEELIRVVAALPSETVPGHRTLPVNLVQQLSRIAAVHDGRVPLHSRLFMQWMHNAYPNECPYPHAAGKTSPRIPEVWMREEQQDATVSLAEMNHFATRTALHQSGQCGQWLDEEELYVPWEKHPLEQRQIENDVHAWIGASSVALLAALASMVLVIMQAYRAVALAGKAYRAKMIVT